MYNINSEFFIYRLIKSNFIFILFLIFLSSIFVSISRKLEPRIFKISESFTYPKVFTLIDNIANPYFLHMSPSRIRFTNCSYFPISTTSTINNSIVFNSNYYFTTPLCQSSQLNYSLLAIKHPPQTLIKNIFSSISKLENCMLFLEGPYKLKSRLITKMTADGALDVTIFSQNVNAAKRCLENIRIFHLINNEAVAKKINEDISFFINTRDDLVRNKSLRSSTHFSISEIIEFNSNSTILRGGRTGYLSSLKLDNSELKNTQITSTNPSLLTNIAHGASYGLLISISLLTLSLFLRNYFKKMVS